MNRKALFFILLFIIFPNIYAEQKIIKQNLTVIATPTNFQIVLEDKTINVAVPVSVNGSNATTTQIFSSEFIRDLTCDKFVFENYVENLTSLSSAIRNCQDIFESNGKNSVIIDILKKNNESIYTELTNISNSFGQCKNETDILRSEKTTAQGLLDTCRATSVPSQNNDDQGLLYGIGGAILGGLAIYHIYVKDKKEKDRDEPSEQSGAFQ